MLGEILDKAVIPMYRTIFGIQNKKSDIYFIKIRGEALREFKNF